MTPDQIKSILELHFQWLMDPTTGKRADLSGANLYGVDLSRASLREARLHRANLARANLYGANLSGANLSDANLSTADLSKANLSGANLSGADLPYPIYQFFLGRQHAFTTETGLRIGCEEYSFEYWLGNYKEIGERHKYSEQDIINHIAVITTFKTIIQGS